MNNEIKTGKKNGYLLPVFALYLKFCTRLNCVILLIKHLYNTKNRKIHRFIVNANIKVSHLGIKRS